MNGAVGKNTVICSKKPSRQPGMNKPESHQSLKKSGKKR